MEKFQQGSNFYVNIISNANIQKPKKILLISPTDKEIHMAFSIRSTKGAIVELYEDTTTSNNGKLIEPINNNRKIKNIAMVQIFEDPNVDTDGIEILKRSDTSIDIPGYVSISYDNSVILKPGTKYQIKITPFTNGSKLENVIYWYEI